MKNIFLMIVAVTILTACNSVYIKPDATIDPAQTVYAADRGGYGMRRSIKHELESRGYKVTVGKAIKNRVSEGDNYDIESETSTVPKDARYFLKTRERDEKFRPIWCAFNGFWWWNFNVSIADQKTGEEIMTWRGRGCANSSVRMLNEIIDKLEKK